MPSLTRRIPALDDLRPSPDWELRPNRTLSVDDFFPLAGQPTEHMVIHGHGFALARADNDVEVGGQAARVVHAEADRLVVLLDGATVTGPVKVTVGPDTAIGPIDYEVLGPVGADENGPPITFAGAGTGAAAGLPSTGTAHVLVVLVAPSDTVPANPTQARQDVVDRWASVHTFYEQASYSKLNLPVDVTTGWTTLTGTAADYLYESGDTNFPNVDWTVMPRLMAEAARAAQDDGRNLNDYGMMAVVLNLNGTFIRAWGGWSAQNFSATDGNGVAINITASHAIDLLAIQESADWGRFAHETGHNVIDNPPSPGPIGATLGEDLYDSDLVDPSAATGQEFDIMGQHDHRPIFSAYHLKTLGWYKPENVTTVQWTRNAFSREFDVVAHGLTQDTAADRVHIVEIRVTPSLSYYVEVRQRPGSTAQVFDPQIPLGSASHEGGVIATKTISGTVNQNQQTRFITLLHDSRVLKQNESAIDPARDLKITVTNDNLQSRPLVCRVKVEWAQTVAGDPDGTFDLRVDPWDSSYQTPDIWVDRQPFGSFDQGFDSEGRPKGNGDKPRPKEINKLVARVHNDGITDAADVRVTLYVVTPPGVGDNGNWAPLQTVTATSIPQADFKDVPVQWVPQVGEHTCLKVYAEKQFGEISTGNNNAQENVFSFEAPASSRPDPVLMPVALRNPSPTERLPVAITVDRVPEGYTVHLDHQWVWLEPLAETQLELWVVPTEDVSHYIREKRADPAPVRVTGRVPHDYKTAAGTTAAEPVGSVATQIGGITASVTPKHRGEIELREAGASNHQAFGSGVVKPGVSGTRVQIVAYGKNGSVGSGFAKTRANGSFSQEFRTFGPPAVKVQAFVVDADVVSECESNVLFV